MARSSSKLQVGSGWGLALFIRRFNKKSFMKKLIKKILFPICILIPTLCFAASFDCKKASNYQEKFICSNNLVDAADAKMGAAYIEARKKITLKGYVVSDQKYWLKTIYKRKCANDSNKPLQEQINSCLTVLEDRITELGLMTESEIFTNYVGDFSDGEDLGTLQIFEKGKNITLKYQGGGTRTTHISYCWGSFELLKSGNKFFDKDDPKTVLLIKNKENIELLNAIYACVGPHGQLPAEKYTLRK
jgi:uncharacterized protein